MKQQVAGGAGVQRNLCQHMEVTGAAAGADIRSGLGAPASSMQHASDVESVGSLSDASTEASSAGAAAASTTTRWNSVR